MVSFSLVDEKLKPLGIGMIILYFLSLNKPEFNEFAQELFAKASFQIDASK